jgi:hypothetical protein
MNCPHCNCHIDAKEAARLAQSEISKEYFAKKPPRSEAQRRADLLARLRRRSQRPVKAGCWSFEIYDEAWKGSQIGSYSDRDLAIGAVQHCRKTFPEYRWKLILHSPNGDVWIPRRGRVANEIIYQCAGHISQLKS